MPPNRDTCSPHNGYIASREATVLGWTLLTGAMAVEDVTAVLGGDTDTSTGQAALKLDLIAPDVAVTLLAVRPWMDEGDTIHLVAYHFNGLNFDLLWDSGAVAVVPGWVIGPTADLPLLPGELYGVGYYIPPGVTAAYPFAELGPTVFSWGTANGSAYSTDDSDPALPDPFFDLFGPHQYYMEIDVRTPEDADGDGVFEEEDCDETDPDVYPGAVERCDGEDDDCDGTPDDDVVTSPWFPDVDGDGFGAGAPTLTCDEVGPPGTVLLDGDCDDLDAAVHPNAPELCNSEDDNCDDLADEGLDLAPAWPDADGDGFGDLSGTPIPSCDPTLPGFAPTGTDCNDGEASINPEEAELCNDRDDDCDDVIDDDTPLLTYWPDADGDGWGDADLPSTTTCEGPPEGHAVASPDCDDADPSRFPGNVEGCNGVDDDCDDVVPDDESADFDVDGALDCADCRPKDARFYPDATELCDGLDHDCDGVRSMPEDCLPWTTVPPASTEPSSPKTPPGTACSGCTSGGGPTLPWFAWLLLRRRRGGAYASS